MAATYRSHTVYNSGSSNIQGTVGMTLNKPSGVADGDTLIAFLGWGDDTGNWGSGLPSGWALASGSGTNPRASATGNDGNVAVAFKHITNAAGEPASYTFTNGGTGFYKMAGFLVCVQGTDSTDPIEELTSGNGTNDFTPATPAITTAVDGCCVLTAHFAMLASVTGKSGGAPSGFTLLQYIETGTGTCVGAQVAYVNQSTAGTISATAWTGTPDDAAAEWFVYTVSVRPGAGATTHNVSISEPATAGESSAPTANFASAISEPATAGASEDSTIAYAVAISEAATAAETQDWIAGTVYDVAISEPATAAASESAVAAFVSAASEAATAAESQSAGLLLVVSISEPATAASQESASAIFAAAASEAVTAGDTPTTLAAFISALTEAVTASESEAASAAYVAALSEAIAAAESQDSYISVDGAISEAVSAAETQSASAAYAGALAEAATAGATQAVVAAYAAAITEAATAAATEAAVAVFVATIAEAASAATSEDAAVVTGQVADITEAVSLADSITAGLVYAVSVSEPVSPGGGAGGGSWVWVG